jgi:hypothetical protein
MEKLKFYKCKCCGKISSEKQLVDTHFIFDLCCPKCLLDDLVLFFN